MKEIFVFGSNRQGRHGKGAALEARLKWGAKNGHYAGRTGDAYAIVTKELRPYCLPVTLGEIKLGVTDFLDYANKHPELIFWVSPIGCGLAGFTPEEIAPMFKGYSKNVYLPESFVAVLKSI